MRRRLAADTKFIEPCLPSPADKPPSDSNWIHEIKHDGYRLMARRDPVGIRLLNPQWATTGRAQFKVDVGVSNVRKCYRVQLFVTKWSTVQSKASKGSNFAMDDTSKKSEPTVRRVVWGRQFLASTVVVPPDVAEHLNTDAMAVLAVIRNEAQASGKCSLPVARIAERANIGRAKTRAAIRLAEGLGLIAIEEMPDRKRVIVNRGVTSRC